MSDFFNVSDLLAKTTAVPVPPFLVKPSGQNTGTINDWYDLDELFQDDFFPKEVDFTNLFSFEDEQFQKNGASGDKIVYPSLRGDGFDNVPEDKTKVIMIPPVMPRTTFPLAVAATSSSVLTSTTTREVAAAEPPRRKVTTKGTKSTKVGEKNTADVEDFDEGDMTEDQRLERRDRNREHAKRSRIRKRVLLDTLQDQLAALRAQNLRLRRVVVDRLPGELAARVLLDCTTEESTLLGDGDGLRGEHVFSSFKPSALTASIAADVVQQSSLGAAKGKTAREDFSGVDGSGKKVLMEPDYRLISSLITSQQNFVLSDPSLPDNPIVYASDGFCRLTGYRRQDILGRNCRFLQGPGTDQAALNMIRQGLAEGRDISVCLLNYRADGSPFWNQFFLGALKDAQGQVVNYVGVQCEVNVLPIAEIKDRVKKLPLPED